MSEPKNSVQMDISLLITRAAIGFLAGMGIAAWMGEDARVLALLFSALGIAYISIDRKWANATGTVAILLTVWSGIFLYTRELIHWQTLPETVDFSGPVEIIERGEIRGLYRPVTLRPVGDWHGGDILYRAPVDFDRVAGERLDFRCALTRPKNFEPGFDYRLLLASRDIGYTCEWGGQSVWLSSGGYSFRQQLAGIQSGFREAIIRLLPEPEAGLLTGLLIGGSDRLTPEMKNAFARAGLSHIVAVSGYNMSVVAEGIVILALILGLWRRWAVGLAIIGLAGFLLIIDGSAASLRAAFMAWLAFGAYFAGRPAASWNGLLIAGVLMLVLNPLLIRYDVGFQLSFLATAALLVFVRAYETFDFFRHWYGAVSALFLTTLIIELFTLPVLTSNFGTFSIIAPLANALILPLVPVAMFVGIAMLALVAIFPSLGFLCGLLSWLPLTMIIRLTEGLAILPGASLSGLDTGTMFAVLWYIGLGIAVFGFEQLRQRYVLGVDH